MSQVVLEMHAGNSAEWELPVTNPDGTSRDLTGYAAATFLAKRRIDDADIAAVITATALVPTPSNGVVEVHLTPSQSASLTPGVYVWAVQVEESTDELWEFPTPDQGPGKLIVHRSVVIAGLT